MCIYNIISYIYIRIYFRYVQIFSAGGLTLTKPRLANDLTPHLPKLLLEGTGRELYPPIPQLCSHTSREGT